MSSLTSFVLAYLFGGLTFIPLLLAAILCHAYYTFPKVHGYDSANTTTEESHRESEEFKEALARLPEELRARSVDSDVAAGYFAVCREYVPGGINGKPPERTTPAGTVIAAESPSVYQHMYKSIFERNKTSVPTLEPGKVNGKALKRARNVFFVVLRHGHLMLYDDAEQLEVRHVISLAHHNIDIYSGGGRIPEGELWIKRNCIRLTKKPAYDGLPDAKPFYLFSDNASAKEDFYHALLQSAERIGDSAENPPIPQAFNSAYMVKLIQQLHASEEHFQTRWINAIIGRLFLALYQTPQIEAFIRTKLAKKIARVNKPAFINSIRIHKVDMGDGTPFFTNPKLRELTIDGSLTVEADVSYKGNFKLEIAAVARIELGSRIKPRQVNLMLAGILRKIEGHVLIKIKPPPSNRIWVTFETMPTLEMTIEPIVSSRQITYGVILRAIESRIREVVGETLVYPNWDDMPFYETELHRYRGGIWKDTADNEPVADSRPPSADTKVLHYEEEDLDQIHPSLSESDFIAAQTETIVPLSPAMTPELGLRSRQGKPSISARSSASTGAELKGAVPRKAMSPGTFANASSPSIILDPATVEAAKSELKRQSVASDVMKDSTSRSPPTSPGKIVLPSCQSDISPGGDGVADDKVAFEDPISGDLAITTPSASRSASTLEGSETSTLESATSSIPKRSTVSQLENHNGRVMSEPVLSTTTKRQLIPQTITTASAAARRWLGNRRSGNGIQSSEPQIPSAETNHSTAFGSSGNNLQHHTEPMGRGHPLPPPGTPLPTPQTVGKAGTFDNWSSTFIKRKPVRSPSISSSSTRNNNKAQPIPSSSGHTSTEHIQSPERPPSLPPRPHRQRRSNDASLHDLPQDAGLLVIEAPVAETSPMPSPVHDKSFEKELGEGLIDAGSGDGASRKSGKSTLSHQSEASGDTRTTPPAESEEQVKDELSKGSSRGEEDEEQG